MEQFGPFHMFFTLSCAESRWDNVWASVFQKEGKTVHKNSSGYTVNGKPLTEFIETNVRSKTEYLKKHYVLITRMFDDRVKAFIKNILMNHRVENYSYRIEFQARGMPHVHGVFWLKQKDIENYCREGGGFDSEKVPSLIDEWISCSLDNADKDVDDVVKEVNVHKHTKSCKKYGTNCRFNFPRLPSDETLIASPLPDDIPEEEKATKLSNAKQILEKVKNYLIELEYEEVDIQLEDLLRNLDIGYDDYKAALRISERGEVVVLKRSVKERYVNNYNRCFIKNWQANMDLQFVKDLHAVVTYVTDYFSKDDTETTKALRKALKETTDCSDFERLNHLKRTYFKQRQQTVAEATYRLIAGMDLKGSNVATVFVSSGFPDNRYKRVYKVEDKAETIEDPDDDTQDQSSGDAFSLEDRAGKYKVAVTVHEKYSARPESVENICLAQFATVYENSRKPGKEVKFEKNSSIITGNISMFKTNLELPKYIILENKESTTMKLRTFPKVLRIHKSFKKKGYEEAYADLLLFFPWRNEVNDLFANDGDECINLFNNNLEVIMGNKQSIYPFCEAIQKMTADLGKVEDVRPQHIVETLDSNAEQENMDVFSEMEPSDTSELPSESNESNHKEKSFVKPIEVQPLDVLVDLTRKLSHEQMVVLCQMVDYFRKIKASNNSIPIGLEPPLFFVHGKLDNDIMKTFNVY